MKAEFIFTQGVLNVPAGASSRLALASPDALRVLLALASEKGNISVISEMTGVPEPKVLEAIAFWQKEGILTVDGVLPQAEKPRPDTRPAYSGEDVERIAKTKNVRELADACSAILGKTFTATETESILYLYDGLRLDFEFIVKLCMHCHAIGKPSLRYIEKVGISLYDEGVTTVAALDSYIEKEARKSDMEYKIRRLYGIGERVLSPKERECLARWTLEWNFPYELIELAYFQMMTAIPQPKFSYENGILKSWAAAGVRTKEDAEALSEKHKKTKKTEQKKEIGFDLDEFFEAATKRGALSEAGTSKKSEE